MARSAAALPLEETLLKALDLSGDEEERFTVDLAWKRKKKHHFTFTARTKERDVSFTVDTGSEDSVILRSYVDSTDIEPCDVKEIEYSSHTVKILGKTSLSLFLGKGQSSQEIVYSFLVGAVSEKACSMLAMDFLTDF